MIKLLVLALAPAMLIGAEGTVPEAVSSTDPEISEVGIVSETASEQLAEETTDGGGEAFDWAEWAEGWFSPQTITTISTVIGFLAVIVKLASELRKLAKDKQLTVDKVSEIVLGQIKETLPEDVSAEFSKYLPTLVAYADKSNEVLNVFAKVLALSQENTTESRLAILELIQQLGIISNDMIDKAKAEVERQKEEEEAKKKAQEEAVTKVIEDTESKEEPASPVGDGTEI